MKGASDKDDILSVFSPHGLNFHHAKNQPPSSETPFDLFCTLTMILAIFVF